MTPEQKVLFDNLNKEKEEGHYKNVTTKIIDSTDLNEAVEKLNQTEQLNNLYAKKEMMIQLFGGRGMDSLNEVIAKMEQDILNKKEI
jgi:hypothetical protein